MQHVDEIQLLKMAVDDLVRRMDTERAYVTKMAVTLEGHIKDFETSFALVKSELERQHATDTDIHKTMMRIGKVVKDMDQELATLFMYSRETMSKVFPGVIDRLGELHDTLEPPKKD
jgi:hypothetical protein